MDSSVNLQSVLELENLVGSDTVEENGVFIDWQTETERMICVAPDIGKLKRPNPDWLVLTSSSFESSNVLGREYLRIVKYEYIYFLLKSLMNRHLQILS